MEIFRRIVFVAVLAGLLAGGLVTVAHHFGTAAIIARAEVYEKAADAASADTVAGMPQVMAGMDHGAMPSDWAPADGLQRTLFTALADMVTAIAFALLLAAAYVISGADIGWRQGMFWGLAGFATFTLAPTLGLPPELPGTAAAPLAMRQLWWGATALATAAALALIFLQRQPVWTLAGVVLLLAPHVAGAPQPLEYRSVVPEALAHRFVVVSVLSSLLFWLLIGSLTGFFHHRLSRPARRTRTLRSSPVLPT